jgi:lysophospholipase
MSFVRVAGNPEPEGAEEHWFEGRGGLRLRTLFAPAFGSPRGTVLLCSGRTEFIEKYFEVIRELQARGFAVLTMDWRGQGLSDRELANRQKGHLQSLDDPAQDLADAVRNMSARLPRPHIVLAHSMGGGIALRAMQTRRIEADAAVFCAPMWGIANLKDLARRFARFMNSIGSGGMFAPGVERKWRKENFKRNVVTHDPERHARAQALVAAEPRLALAGVTLAWVNAAADAIDGFSRPSALAHLRIPILVASAGEEKLVDNASHEEIARLLPNCRHILIPGARHEILMETDDKRAQLWAAFDALVDPIAPKPAAQPTIA